LLNEVGLSLFRYFEVGLRVCDIVVNKYVRSLSHLLISSCNKSCHKDIIIVKLTIICKIKFPQNEYARFFVFWKFLESCGFVRMWLINALAYWPICQCGKYWQITLALMTLLTLTLNPNASPFLHKDHLQPEINVQQITSNFKDVSDFLCIEGLQANALISRTSFVTYSWNNIVK